MDIKEFKVLAEEKKNHPWEYARCSVIDSILKKHIKPSDSKSFVLDIGCGDVFFISNYCKRNSQFTPIAVDIAFDDTMINYFKEKHRDLRMELYKNLSDVIISDSKKISMVFLLDVIEHIEKDEDFVHLVASQSYITKDTLFIITVPAFQSAYCLRDKWLGHYRRYSKKQLDIVAQKNNFEKIESGYFFTIPLLARYFQKGIEKLNQKKEEKVEGIGNWKGGNLITALYKGILMADFYIMRFFHLLGINIPGLSTYIVCKPQK